MKGTILLRCQFSPCSFANAVIPECPSAYPSRETVRYLKKPLQVAGIEEGAVFRRLRGTTAIGERLGADSVSALYKSVVKWLGWPEKHVNEVSGHSIRELLKICWP